MSEDKQVGEMIAGVVLSQAILVRILEDRGVLAQGELHAALAEYLEGVSAERRDGPMYQPLRQLLKSLPPLPGAAH